MIPAIWTEIFVTENGCSSEQIQQAEQRLGKPLPQLLRVFYEKFGCHPLNQVHNRLIKPELLEPDVNGLVCFYEENQDVVLWAIQIADFYEDDPIVYESYDNGKTWISHDDKEPLFNFLTDVSLFQAIMGGFPFTAGHFGVEKSIEAMIIGQFPPVAADVAKRGMRYYGNTRRLLAIMEGEQSNDLWIACQKKTPFLKLLRQFKISWDYNSIDD